MSKEYRSLEKIVNLKNQYAKVVDDITFNKEVLNSDDDEMREMAKDELPGLQQSNIQSMNIKIKIAAITNAIADRTICHLSTSR